MIRLTLLLLLLFPAVAAAEPHPALVMLGDRSQCSGICVSPEGVVITARHCTRHEGQAVRVSFPDGQNHVGHVAYIHATSDLAVIRLSGNGPFPTAPLAEVAPVVGDRVWSEGYPNGQYARMEGVVSYVGHLRIGKRIAPRVPLPNPVDPVDTVLTIVTNHRVLSGNSGGPLFNQSGEVVGITSLSTQDGDRPGSWFMHIADIRASLAAAGVRLQVNADWQTVPKFYVVTSKDCEPCVRFKQDYVSNVASLRSRLDEAYDVHIVQNNEALDVVRRYNLDTWPSFVDTRTGIVYIGYTGPEQMLKVLGLDSPRAYRREEAKSSKVVIMSEIQEQPQAEKEPPPNEEPKAKPEPEPEEKDPADADEQRSYVRVVILGENLDVGAVKGMILSIGESKLKSYLGKLVEQAFGGAVSIDFVFQRLESERYDAIVEATGVNVRYGAAVILARKQARFDFISDKVAKLERFIKSLTDTKLKNIPVEVLFERDNPELYSLAVDSLSVGVTSAPAEEGEEDEGKLGWIHAILAAIGFGEGSWLRRRIKKRRMGA